MSRLPALALVLAFAAPAPNEKEVKPGPVSDEQRIESPNNRKRILLGMHNFEAACGFLPNNLADAKRKLLLKWRVAALPHLEVDGGDVAALSKEFKLDKSWDG